MSYTSEILKIKLNLNYALNIFKDESLSKDIRMLALSKLVSIGIIHYNYLNYFDLLDFHVFFPSFTLCGKILNFLGDYEPVLLACIALKYNALFFKYKGDNHSLYYKYACKFNNIEIINYELKENGFKKLDSIFDYSLFITGA